MLTSNKDQEVKVIAVKCMEGCYNNNKRFKQPILEKYIKNIVGIKCNCCGANYKLVYASQEVITK
jgi:hypothetical protein